MEGALCEIATNLSEFEQVGQRNRSIALSNYQMAIFDQRIQSVVLDS